MATPLPTPEDAQANATFDALLWALSRPGLPRTLQAPAPQAIAQALIDRECAVYAADPLLVPSLLQQGAALVELPQADHAFLGQIDDAHILHQIRLGSDLYPDDGATVIATARFGTGPRLALSGPGVEGRLEIALDGLPNGFWQLREQIMRYPMGFDLILSDRDQVIGLPRSTKIEVL